MNGEHLGNLQFAGDILFSNTVYMQQITGLIGLQVRRSKFVTQSASRIVCATVVLANWSQVAMIVRRTFTEE